MSDEPGGQLAAASLGRSPLQISRVVFGAMALSRDYATGDRVRVIRAALDAGITSIDTAPLYELGRCEEVVGEAIRDVRNRVQVLTKVGLRWDASHGELFLTARGPDGQPREVRRDSRPEAIRRDVVESLQRLSIEHLDLVQIHQRDPETPIAETMGELLRLMQEGKLGAIGVSNFGAAEMAEAQAALGDVPLASVQSRYSCVRREVEREVLPAAIADSVGFLAYSPLEKSLLAGRLLDGGGSPGRTRAGLLAPRNARKVGAVLRNTVAPIAERHEASFSQIALAWLLAQPGVTGVIAGASSPEQASDNARASAIALTEVEIGDIRRAYEELRLDPSAGQSFTKRVRIRLGALRRRLLR